MCKNIRSNQYWRSDKHIVDYRTSGKKNENPLSSESVKCSRQTPKTKMDLQMERGREGEKAQEYAHSLNTWLGKKIATWQTCHKMMEI